MKQFLFLLLIIGCVSADKSDRTELTTGYRYRDTITDFRADSVKYSDWFNMSGFNNIRVDMMINDTSSAGFVSDSINATWGIQTSRYLPDTNETAFRKRGMIMYTCDSLNIYSATYEPIYYDVITGPTFTKTGNVVDTLGTGGFNIQSANPSPEYDVYMRVWVKGGAGNEIGSFLDTRCVITQRTKEPN